MNTEKNKLSPRRRFVNFLVHLLLAVLAVIWVLPIFWIVLKQATLQMRSDGMYILFDQPQRGVTPGQFAAWYSPDGEMIGSGPIKE